MSRDVVVEMEKKGKSEVYKRCWEETIRRSKNRSLLERMWIVCSILKENIPYYFWAGFYLPKEDFLELGPSKGPPACVQIPLTGVCGQAVKNKRPIIVPDVNKFPRHISCDSRSKSEIALPVFDKNRSIIAVFDVDCENSRCFDKTDKEWLEKILRDSFST